MAWTVEFAAGVEKDLRRLATSDQRRIIRFLKERVEAHSDPRSLVRPLKGDAFAGLWRFRVGDHRVVVEFIDARLVVLVIEVAHRAQVYR